MYDRIRRQSNDEAIARALHEGGAARSRSRSRSRERPSASAWRPSASPSRPSASSASASVDPNANVGVGTACSICLVDMDRSDTRRILGCNEQHVFHDSCIKRWLGRGQSRTCPVCRGAVVRANNTIVKATR